MQIDNGWLSSAARVPSPNYNSRPDSADISLLVIHNISLPPGRFGGGHIEQLFTNCLDPNEDDYFASICQLEVSAHLLIDREGEITQFVPFTARAWHAGESCFQQRENCNDFSIGIEMEGADDIAYTDAQYRALAEVTRMLCKQYQMINPDRIVGHSEIAPGRKTDPGPAFDWNRYRQMLDQ